jgi:hypothetical protein
LDAKLLVLLTSSQSFKLSKDDKWFRFWTNKNVKVKRYLMSNDIKGSTGFNKGIKFITDQINDDQELKFYRTSDEKYKKYYDRVR